MADKYLALESAGPAGIEEHSFLRALEEKLSSVGGEKFQVEEFREPATFQKQVRT